MYGREVNLPEGKNTFDHHTPTPEQVKIIESIRAAYKQLGQQVQGLKGLYSFPGQNVNALRYLSLAFTELEASAMWAIKGVIFAEEPTTTHPGPKTEEDFARDEVRGVKQEEKASED